MSSITAAAATPTAIAADEIVITEELQTRPARPRDPAREIEAVTLLGRCMLRQPEHLQQCFVDLALELCPAAGSAGISMLEPGNTDDDRSGNSNDETVFRWTALAGALAPHLGGLTPRHFSPCGLCLDRKSTILVSHPARLFTYLSVAAIAEGLIVPLNDADNETVGTIWIVSHDTTCPFDATDAVVMEQLAGFFAVAMRMASDASLTAQRVAKEKAKRKAAEAALRQSMKMEALGQLTGGVAHDFNNLLSVISATFELLESRIGDNAALRAVVNRGANATQRAAHLTHRLLAFARREPLAARTVDLRERLPEIVELLRPTIGTGITVAIDFAADLWPVRTDENELEMAVVNIAVNARDAMPPGGGIISIKAQNATLSEEAVIGADEVLSGEFVALAIGDTGVGMPPDVMSRVFEPFFTTKDVGKGTGLGLSMVYSFARETGGGVTVSSGLGKGTTITLYLPRAAATSDRLRSSP
jgi:signal transduction histidine kinase